jgi:hypothetical protein
MEVAAAMAAAWGQRGVGGGGSVAGIAAAALLREVQLRQYGSGSSAVAVAVRRWWQHGSSSIAVVAAWPQPWGRVGSSGR